MRRNWRIIIFVLTGLLLVTACGGSAVGTNTSADADEAAAVESGEADAARDRTCSGSALDVLNDVKAYSDARTIPESQTHLEPLSDSLIEFTKDLEAAGEDGNANRFRYLIGQIDSLKEADKNTELQWTSNVLAGLEDVLRDCADLQPGDADRRREEFLDSGD